MDNLHLNFIKKWSRQTRPLHWKSARHFMKRELVLAVTISVLLYPFSIFALKDYKGGEWERGFFLGIGAGAGLFVDDNNTNMDPLGSVDFQLGYDVWKYLSIGGRFGQIGGYGRLYDPLYDVASMRNLYFFYFDFFVKAKPLYSRLAPYVIASVGMYNVSGKGAYGRAFNVGDGLHVQAGAGAEFNISRRNTIGIEAVYNYFNAQNGLGAVNLQAVYRFTF